MDSRKIKHITTTTYNPKSNPIERYNKEIVRLLRLFCNDNHTSWYPKINYIIQLLNHSCSSVTGLSPSELFLHEDMKDSIFEEIGWPEQIKSLPWKRKLFLAEIRTRQSRRSRKIKNALNSIKLQTGDLVMIKNRQVSSKINSQIHKLFNLYIGPFLVKEIKNNNAILYTMNQQYYDKVNFSNLRVFNCSEEKRNQLLSEN